MPPKRGKASQNVKAGVTSPQKSNSRKKTVTQSDEELESSKVATPRRSRAAKAKEEPSPEIKTSTPAKKAEKPKGRTTRAQLAATEDEGKSPAKGTPKKVPAPKRNSRQKKTVSSTESDYEEGSSKEEVVSTVILHKVTNQSKRNEETDVIMPENTSEVIETEDICQTETASHKKEEQSANIDEGKVKASPVKRGKKAKVQAERKSDSQEEHTESSEENSCAGKTDSVAAEIESDKEAVNSKEKETGEEMGKRSEIEKGRRSQESPVKRGKRVSRSSTSKSEEILESVVKSEGLKESTSDVVVMLERITVPEEAVQQGKCSDKQSKEENNDNSKISVIEPMDTEDSIMKGNYGTDNLTAEEQVVVSNVRSDEMDKEDEISLSKDKTNKDSVKEKKGEEIETDGDSISTASLEKGIKEEDSSEGFEGFEVESLEKGGSASLNEISLGEQLGSDDKRLLSEEPGESKKMEVDDTGCVENTEEEARDQDTPVKKSSGGSDENTKQLLQDKSDLCENDLDTANNEELDDCVRVVRRSSRQNVEQSGTELGSMPDDSDDNTVEAKTRAGRSTRSRRAAKVAEKIEVESSEAEIERRGRRACTKKVAVGAKDGESSSAVENKLVAEENQGKDDTPSVGRKRAIQKSAASGGAKLKDQCEGNEFSDKVMVDSSENFEKEKMKTEVMDSEYCEGNHAKNEKLDSVKQEMIKDETCQSKQDVKDCDGNQFNQSVKNEVIEFNQTIKKETCQLKDLEESSFTTSATENSGSVESRSAMKKGPLSTLQETGVVAKEKTRKSRWDDPTKFEDRTKASPISVNEGITTRVTSSAVPVKIITTRKEKIDKDSTGWSAVDDNTPVVSESFVEKFECVVLLTNPLYSKDLKTLYSGNHIPVNTVATDDLSPDMLIDVVKMNKSKYPLKSLWILVSGIYDIAEVSNHPSCQKCNFTLKQLMTTDLPIESITDSIQDRVNRFSKVYHKVQKILEPNGVFILSPPIPLRVPVEDAYHNHGTLHRACYLNYSVCVACVKVVQFLYVSYNIYCDVWMKLTCQLMTSVFPDTIFKNYHLSSRGLNFIGVTEMKEHEQNPKQVWCKMMQEVMKVTSTLPFPTTILPEKKSQAKGAGMFKRAVLIGNVKFLESLKPITTNLPVSFIDEDVFFDEDGMNLLKEEQEKWPPKTICIILNGVSCIVEPIENGPKCQRASCATPLPVFVPKNHPQGDSDYFGKSAEDMVSDIVNEAFSFAQNAIDILKDGSAIFLAPIVPLRAIWGNKQSKLSHDALHKLAESESIPVFSASQSEWFKCAQTLEDKWIQMTMENLDPSSSAYSLYEKYMKEKPEILQFITESSELDSNFRSAWSNLVFDILNDFLYSTEAAEDHEDDIKVYPSDYSDLQTQAETYYSEGLFAGSKNNSQNYKNQRYDDSNSGQNTWSNMEQSEGWNNQSNQSSYQSSQNSYMDQSYADQSYVDQSYSYQGQSYPPYQGVDPSYASGSWMGGPSPSWTAGPPPGFPQGLPPGPPPAWGTNTNQWMPAQSMWGAPPPPGPPPSWGNGSMPQWSTTAPPPPPSWTSGPPPAIPPVSSAPAPTSSWQSVPPPQPSQPKTETLSNKSEMAQSGTNIMIQNVTTDMKIEQAKKLLETFGEMTYLKWPLDHLNKPAKFLMASYAVRDDAEKCARVVNYVRPFGKDSEVKVVGVSVSGDKGEAVNSQDVREISIIQDLLNKIKDENSVKIRENSNRVVVSNISNLIPRKFVDALFLSLRANRSFKNFDLSVISSEEELHYFVCGTVLNVKMMDGYRFPDKKLKVKLVGPDEEKSFAQGEMDAARREIELLMKKYVDSISDLVASKYINKKEVNIYTFKTVRCQNEKNCKNPGLCHDYHMWKDRRRCPILFRYSEEMCPNLDSNGKCPAKDKCSKAHSPLEVPFHLKNFRAHICTSARKKGYCDKTDKICAYLHPGTTETFYDRQWRDVYVEGLDRSITYFVGAIMNLFKVSKQNCVRVLLITPAPELVTFLVKSMEALSFSCDQEISALSQDGSAKKSSILVGTPQAVINWMAEGKRNKNVNLDRLKALIIDDGPAVVEFIETHGHNFLIEFAKIKDLNKVITAEKIHRQDVTALERLRILTDYKKIYQKDDRPRRSPSPRGRSSSPKRTSHKDSSSGRDKRLDDDRRHYSREREKEKYPSAESKVYERNIQYEEQMRQEREKEEVMREQERLLREQLNLQEQIRREEERKREEELRREQQMRHDLQMMKEREEQMRREQEMKLEQERRREQERLELENKKKEEEKQKNYEKFIAAKEDLKREHERERKLYLELPEVHPEYEEKYRVFLDQYETHYPGRNDAEHRNKLWMLFWKELVSSMLETAYKKKREILEMEFLRSRGGEQTEADNSSLKRKAPTDGKGPSKYPRSEEFDQPRTGTSTSSIPMTQGLTSSQAAPSFSSAPSASSQYPQVSGSTISIPHAVAIINEICDCLGELGPAVRLVLQKVHAVNKDPLETGKIFTDSDNAMILKLAAGKMKEACEQYGTPIKEKLALASYQAMQLLELTSLVSTAQKKPYHGLDIQKVARATFDKDPAFIVQFIKNALLYEGVENPSQDDISDIFVTISNAHFSMASK